MCVVCGTFVVPYAGVSSALEEEEAGHGGMAVIARRPQARLALAAHLLTIAAQKRQRRLVRGAQDTQTLQRTRGLTKDPSSALPFPSVPRLIPTSGSINFDLKLMDSDPYSHFQPNDVWWCVYLVDAASSVV